MDRNYINCGEIPLGLSMALAQNLKAMENFSVMKQEEKDRHQNLINLLNAPPHAKRQDRKSGSGS